MNKDIKVVFFDMEGMLLHTRAPRFGGSELSSSMWTLVSARLGPQVHKGDHEGLEMNRALPEGLPPNAQRVFKGEYWEVWRWEQEMYDGSTSIFERVKRDDSVTVIPIVGETILIQHQEQPAREPFISFPGGFFEGDPLLEAQRELLEETGYVSDDWRWYMTCEPGGAKMMWKNHVYIARNCVRVQEPTPDAGEKISLAFVSFDELLVLADDPLWRHADLVPMMLRARYEPVKRQELMEALFG